MTVAYRSSVSTIGFLGGNFLGLLFRWKGSIYKLIWPELLLYMLIFFTFQWTYGLVLNPAQRKIFENISRYCSTNEKLIPLQFVLGFFVNMVVDRWWRFVKLLPYPDNTAICINSIVEGLDEEGRTLRRTMVRYLNLAYILAMRKLCPPLNSRFPSYKHLVEAGIMNEDERKILDRLDRISPHHKYIIPIVWTGMLFESARDEGRINGQFCLQNLWEQLQKYRQQIHTIIATDWVCIPLVYTQFATIAIYAYFASCLFSKQFLRPEDSSDLNKEAFGPESNRQVDLYFPFFLFLEFFFYMGWLKVTEFMFSPFGEDDDDFDINWMIDRHLEVSYLYVDELHFHYPHLLPCNLSPLEEKGENVEKDAKPGKIRFYSSFLLRRKRKQEDKAKDDGRPPNDEPLYETENEVDGVNWGLKEDLKRWGGENRWDFNKDKDPEFSEFEGKVDQNVTKESRVEEEEIVPKLRKRRGKNTYLIPDRKKSNIFIPYTKAAAHFLKRKVRMGSVGREDMPASDDYFVEEEDEDEEVYSRQNRPNFGQRLRSLLGKSKATTTTASSSRGSQIEEDSEDGMEEKLEEIFNKDKKEEGGEKNGGRGGPAQK